MPRIARTIALVLAVLIAAPALLPAQEEEPTPVFEEELAVTEVLLDVLVTDAGGNVILGLGEEDFVVEEAGAPVDLTGATFYSNRRFLESADLAERLGVDASNLPVDRYFILFFHEARRQAPQLLRNQLEAIRKAKQWVAEDLLPNDWVSVVSYDAKLRLHQDFTTDNSKIVRALNEVAKGKDPSGVWASRVSDEGGPSLAQNLPKGQALAKNTRRIYSGLEVLGEAAGYIIGRKNLIMLSPGFGEVNDAGTYIPDQRYYPPMMRSLNDNNVAVYSVSLFENIADELPGFDLLNNGLSLLADDTGGRYYFNFVNFREPFNQIGEDNNGYYMLSFEARYPVGEDGYREVTVKTVNPAFVVRARQGYEYGS